jgi:hypothetical protein
MAELNPIPARPGVGPVRAPRGEKPRRFVATSADASSGYWTYQSPEEEEESNRQYAEAQAQRQAQLRYLDPGWQAQQAAEKERQAEEARTAGPPKRAVLLQARMAYDEAQAEMARLHGAVERARNFRDDIEIQRADIEAALKDAEAEATSRLVENFTGNDNGPDAAAGPLLAGSQAASLRSSLLESEGQLEPARGAVERLEGELVQTRQRLGDAAHALQTAGLDLLVDYAIDRAAEIVEAEGELAKRRGEIDQLARFVTERRRRLSMVPRPLPTALERFRHSSAEANKPDTWADRFAAIVSDPTAPLPGEDSPNGLSTADTEASLSEIEPAVESETP